MRESTLFLSCAIKLIFSGPLFIVHCKKRFSKLVLTVLLCGAGDRRGELTVSCCGVGQHLHSTQVNGGIHRQKREGSIERDR
jgi:hypothetical protein